MDIKKKIKQRIWIFITYIIIGAVFCVLRYMGMGSDILFSIGVAFIVCGAVQSVRLIRLINNPEKLEERSIAEKDERNIMLWNKARSMAFAIYIYAAAIGMAIAYVIGQETVGLTLAYSICGLVIIYWISYYILRSKY